MTPLLTVGSLLAASRISCSRLKLLLLPFGPPQASPSPSPVGYSPMTPGAPSPGGYNPHTPGSNIEQGSSDWVTTDILVRVKDSFMDLMGQIGVIRSVTVTVTRHWWMLALAFSISLEP